VAFASSGATTTKAPSLDLLARAVNPNPTLQSYIASANLAATLHAPVPVRKTFTGTCYYLRPQRKVIFENVPGPLSRFRELAEETPSFEELTLNYTITPLNDDGMASTYNLVPKKSGSRVAAVKVAVDDNSALASRLEWSYANGGTLRADQTYTTVGSFHVIDAEVLSARFPDYSVDGRLTFSNYKLNAAVDPSIFSTK
jgi:hypothetical protein